MAAAMQLGLCLVPEIAAFAGAKLSRLRFAQKWSIVDRA